MNFRASARHKVDARIDVRSDAGRERSARLVELGMRGARLVMDDPPPEGTVLRMTMRPPTSWQALVVDGVVRWREHDSGSSVTLGVELSPLSPDAVRVLFGWLALLPVRTA